ncbi:hypothetical protein [Amphritea sp. HPY]|uniref:hypothetical protein n=1 Tax=Amphritea sp. HPY TaxID=3421652 RepID=UPI003D7EAEFF
MKTLPILISAVLLSGCSSWQKQPETEKLMGGYRTQGAANALLGSYGVRLRHGINQFQRFGVPNWNNIETRHVATVTIDKDSSTGLENLSASIAELGQVQAGASWTQQGQYKITFLQIYDLVTLRREIEKLYLSDPEFAEAIRNPEIRFITTAGIIFDHNWTRQFEGSLEAGIEEIRLSGDTNLANLSVTMNSTDNQTINIANNTVVSYQFVRICWDKNDARIRALIRDQKGVDSSACPAGSDYKYPHPEGA